jgi:hypothetical protein
MHIRIKRNRFTTRSTIGRLTIDLETFSCFTIEDVARAEGVKIPRETAIPAGVYMVVMDWSPRHRSIQPHILNVPLFTYIRFDVANYAEQVEGCIAVGAAIGTDAVWDSKRTHAALCDKIAHAIANGEIVWLTVTNEPEN